MRPIERLKSKTMSKAMRKYLKEIVWAAGFRKVGMSFDGSLYHRPIIGSMQCRRGVISAAKAAGVRLVPNI